MLGLVLPVLGRYVLRVLRRVERHSPRLIGFVVRIGSIVDGLQGRRPWILIGSSLLVWCCFLGIYQTGASAFGLDSRIAETMLAGAAGSFAFVLPINGVANIGPAQAAWAAVLNQFGQPWDQAIAAGLAINLINLCVTGVISAVLWMLGAGGRAAVAPPPPNAPVSQPSNASAQS